MIGKRVAVSFAVASAVAGFAGTWVAPTASAQMLSNGLDVTCNPVGDLQLTCVIGGCPRVNGDYVVDAVHVMQNGHQDEYPFKCINGATATHSISTTLNNPITLGFQACRKKDLEGDWCGGWADYTWQPPAAPPPPAAQPAQAPPPAEAPKPAEPPPPPAAVTNAITLSFGAPTLGSITAMVSNSSDLNGKCTYDATPFDTHRDFTVPARGSTPLTFKGLNTGTTYHAVVQCADASGKQSEPIGRAEQDVTF